MSGAMGNRWRVAGLRPRRPHTQGTILNRPVSNKMLSTGMAFFDGNL
jgi:hypothetical protein